MPFLISKRPLTSIHEDDWRYEINAIKMVKVKQDGI